MILKVRLWVALCPSACCSVSLVCHLETLSIGHQEDEIRAQGQLANSPVIFNSLSRNSPEICAAL